MITRFLFASILVASSYIVAPGALAMDPDIRLYKKDKRQGITKSHYLFGKGDNPGCHNLPFRYAVFRITVIRFKSCSVFSEKDCPPDSVIPAYWKKKDNPATKLTRGAHWYLNRNEDNVDVASWSCE